MNAKIQNYIFYSVIFLSFTPIVSAPVGLALGILFSIFKTNHYSYPVNTSKISKLLLQLSIVFMGFGLNLEKVVNSFTDGFILTVFSVTLTILIGLLIGKLLKLDSNITKLVSCGTAICGGSAIAAIASVIKPKDYQISFALTVVFVLNAIALFIFPAIGHFFNMSQQDFGLWSAIAIHDTSSVVGAASAYGNEALEIATTVKLTRALWIIPISIVFSLFNKTEEKSKLKLPWFILFFVLAILFSFYFPSWDSTYNHLYWFGKKGMIISLFMIGANLNKADLKKAGAKSFILGVSLWIIISVFSFLFITA
jgi:uncharacterized integral membrane protein (TIGR00698 family)